MLMIGFDGPTTTARAASEATEDASQHLVQRAVDAGLLQPDEGDESCSEPTMMRLLDVTAAAADLELRRLANRLEALLLREFPAKLVRH